ncbi:SGNH/GDSL hydrolase family protein [Streptomyces sp. MUM 203J]|uniref:SGNH/GDSL hydrolase family protein n=1 Tax=Streptomyces sp. MUM 203J TaxID=2791990 RepID=UPI001F040F0A|nr:SGNH/GDSL hydrolase family protein [Streptomyces sp. MUM 203J]MCH0541448.1 SGNH/GDSL hydrolase family protein [Streptomyces sp. MUM 203J]
MDAGITAKLVRFQQPEKVLPHLPGLDESRIAALFGLTPSDYRALREEFATRTREAAAGLLADPALAGDVGRLPFAPGQRIAVLGESTTADRLSWCEILRHLLPDGTGLANLAVSGCTTTQALTTQLPALSSQRPDWVLCMLGGNDAQRLGPDGGTRLVSQDETARNLRTLFDLSATDGAPRWLWLTPTGVDEARVRAYPYFRKARITWTNRDIDRIAAFLADRPEPTVDTREPAAGRHMDDGVHLTLDGQRSVAAAVVRALARRA